MKNIDIKSLIIGVLLASTVFFGMAATYNIAGPESRSGADKPIQSGNYIEEWAGHRNVQDLAVRRRLTLAEKVLIGHVDEAMDGVPERRRSFANFSQ